MLATVDIIADEVREAEMQAALGDFPRFIDLIAAGAKRDPEARALIYLRSVTDPQPAEYTYDVLFGLVQTAATRFRAMGVGREDVVATLVPACPASMVAILGAAVEAISMPLNLLFSREAIIAQLNATGAKFLIVPPPGMPGGLFERVAGIKSDAPALEHVVVVPIDGHVAFDGVPLQPDFSWREAFANNTADSAEADRVAAMLPTGGTTGHPKIARLKNRNCVVSCVSSRMALDFRQGDRAMVALPLFHVGGLFVGIGAVFSAGGAVVIPSPAGARDPAFIPNFWHLIERFRLTHAGNVPTVLGAAAQVPNGGIDISCLRVVPTGASICPPEIERRFLAAWGGTSLKQCYGMTEVAGAISHDFHDRPVKFGHVGTRNPLFELAVLAGDTLHTRWPSPTGELVVRGPQVFAGYVDPQQTKSAFRDGWLCTGDLCRIDADGYIEILGRVKDLIIRGGHNIDPVAIEDVALAFPGIALAAAVGRPDPYAGEVPMLFVTAQPGAVIDTGELLSFVAEKLIEPPARPRAVEVIGEMPVTPIGKIFKPKLREIAAAAAATELLAAEGIESARIAARTDSSIGLVVAVELAGDGERAKRLLEQLPVRIEIKAAALQ